MSEIQDFWTLDQTKMDKAKIKQKCREYYTDDFINNYTKWRGNVDHMNSDVKSSISNIIPIDKYVDITFDQWCGRILELFDNFIELHGKLGPENVTPQCRVLIEEHCTELIKDWSLQQKSVASILESVKKVIIR
jgi:hypothetical protein